MSVPNFIIIGEQKAGTGWLRDRLLEHPEVYISKKEINFFNRKSRYARGVEFYLRNFRNAGGAVAVGEKSPEYFWMNSCKPDYISNPVALIKEVFPEIKVILILRDPVSRAVSALNHHLHHRGRRINPRLAKSRSADKFLLGEMAVDLDERFGLMKRGFYADRVKYVRDVFGDNALVLIFEEDIVAHPKECMEKICAHIGVDSSFSGFKYYSNNKQKKHSYSFALAGYYFPILRPLLRNFDFGAPFYLKLSDNAREMLRSKYASDIRELERILHRSLACWE
jgi:hypothetical protein